MELDRLQGVFSSKEAELRDAVSKVESLRAEIDQLQKRRQSAATAALAMACRVRDEQQQQQQQQQLVGVQRQKTEKAVEQRIDELIGHLRINNENRPRAAIEPFKVTLFCVRQSLINTGCILLGCAAGCCHSSECVINEE